MKFILGLILLTLVAFTNAQEENSVFKINFNTFNPLASDNNKCVHASAGVGGQFMGQAAIILTMYKDKKLIDFSRGADKKLASLSFKQDSQGFQVTEFGPCPDQMTISIKALSAESMQLSVSCKNSSDQLILETEKSGYLTRVKLQLNGQNPIEGLFAVQSGSYQSSCGSVNMPNL